MTNEDDAVILSNESVVNIDFPPSPVNSQALLVDVDGYEGPLDLLLALARVRKIDITRISILDLAEQYLLFIHDLNKVRIEIAADYLVMAAWLAYLKSKLLLPEEDAEEGPSGKELSARLAFRLQRLQAMRNVGAALFARNLLGRDVFVRGSPEGIHVIKSSKFKASIYDLLTAYATRRAVNVAHKIRFRKLPVISIKEARVRLERLVGNLDDWTTLNILLGEHLVDDETRQSVIASSFTATLEMVREGAIELRQTEHYDQLFIRRKPKPDQDQDQDYHLDMRGQL